MTYPLPVEPAEIARNKDISPVGLCFWSQRLFRPGTNLMSMFNLAAFDDRTLFPGFYLPLACLSKAIVVHFITCTSWFFYNTLYFTERLMSWKRTVSEEISGANKIGVGKF
ncbi:MAG: hypothetical protein LC633_05135 [Desulfobulbaceae bacterium]|nr:hypothetical protein [Desulfobulbaceae bacterium]